MFNIWCSYTLRALSDTKVTPTITTLKGAEQRPWREVLFNDEMVKLRKPQEQLDACAKTDIMPERPLKLGSVLDGCLIQLCSSALSEVSFSVLLAGMPASSSIKTK